VVLIEIGLYIFSQLPFCLGRDINAVLQTKPKSPAGFTANLASSLSNILDQKFTTFRRVP